MLQQFFSAIAQCNAEVQAEKYLELFKLISQNNSKTMTAKTPVQQEPVSDAAKELQKYLNSQIKK